MASDSNQSLPVELIREFVLASHGDLNKVKQLYVEHPDLLHVQFDWGPGGLEDGIGAAAHVGNRDIAQFFLDHDVPSTIYVSAMMGRLAEVESFLTQDRRLANARGAHGITLMFHTAMSGNIQIAQSLLDAGCNEGFSDALHGAIAYAHKDMVLWLLNHGANDVNVLNWQNKSPLDNAVDMGQEEIASILRERGALQTSS